MKKLVLGILFLGMVLVISGCNIQKSGIGEIPVKKVGGGGGNPPTNDTLTEYPFRIEIEEDMDIGNWIYDGVRIRALADSPDVSGIRVGPNITTDDIFAVKPYSLGTGWDSIFYSNEDNEWVLATPDYPTFFYVPGQDYIPFGYNKNTGQIYIENKSEVVPKDIFIQVLHPLEDNVDGFMDFGHGNIAEPQELYICGMGYFGNSTSDVEIGDHLIIREPDTYGDNDVVVLSFYV